MPDPPTGTVTFLFTDIQGSTAMWERDAKRMQAALARQDEIMKSLVAEHGGRAFKMIGDACCAAFLSAPNALEAALDAQRAIFAEPWDERSRVRVRMALHTGEVEERDGDYFGPPVNRVARLLAAGHGGQTLLSRATREQVEGRLPEGVSVRDMGERRLKDPERIHQLLAPDLPSEFPPLKTLETASNEDRYRLIRQIGSGGMAEVYLAYDEFLQREVAFKVLDRKYAENREAIERFRREAKNAASLRHPNIVDTYDRGETEAGTYYIVMEYLEGGTLEDLIDEAGPLQPREAAEIALEITDALQLAHDSGVIHRDIKPQNILLSGSGEAKVADFGIARAASATTMTQAGSILGTVHYISPEQALGELATPKSDLYSLGVVLYEMLTGELPYDAETPVGVVMKHVSGLSRSVRDTNPEMPEELDAIVARLLSKDPEERYTDAALAEDLERVIETLPPAGRTREAMLGVKPAGTRATRSTRSGTSGRKLGTGAGAVRAEPARVPGTRRQRVGVLVAMMLVLVSIGIIAFVALTRGLSTGGGQDGSSAKDADVPTLEGKKLPEVGNLPPGKYVTDQFKPTMSFTLGGNDEWQIGAQLPDILNVTPVNFVVPKGQPDRPPNLSFVSPRKVYKPFDPSRGEKLSPAPEDMVAWIRNHPDLKIEKSEPVTVGGVSGVQFDVSTAVGDSDVVLFRVGGGNEFFLANGNENRIIVLQDVGGQTVVIVIDGTKAQFEGFLPETQKVLDTVEWEAES